MYIEKRFYEEAFKVQEYMRSKNITPYGLIDIAEIIKTVEDMNKGPKIKIMKTIEDMNKEQNIIGGKMGYAKKEEKEKT